MDRGRNMDRDRDRVRIGIGTEIGICTYCLINLFLYPFFEVSLCLHVVYSTLFLFARKMYVQGISRGNVRTGWS